MVAPSKLNDESADEFVTDLCVWLTLLLLDCQKKISSATSRAINTITSSVIKLRRIARASASLCPI